MSFEFPDRVCPEWRHIDENKIQIGLMDCITKEVFDCIIYSQHKKLTMKKIRSYALRYKNELIRCGVI